MADTAHLSGLALAPKDGQTHLARIPLTCPASERLSHINNVLLTMQSVGYEVLNFQIESGAAFLSPYPGALVLYK